MTDLEAEDAQTIHPLSRQPGCRCPDPSRACACDDGDGDTGEPREWSHSDKPAPVVAPQPAAPAHRG